MNWNRDKNFIFKENQNDKTTKELNIWKEIKYNEEEEEEEKQQQQQQRETSWRWIETRAKEIFQIK